VQTLQTAVTIITYQATSPMFL